MKKIFYILLLAFVVIQFFQIDKTNPPVDESQDFLKINNTPEAIATQIKASCYDCHSNESKYPWYSNIQPVAWFLKHHIDEGREELNFSEFGTYTAKRQAHKLDECAELIEKDEMPLSSYTIIHKDAVLDEATQKQLITYFKEMEGKLKE
ncbi:MAG: heme-binding domain-containing protein [Flavobacterium sp.]|nr:heme-binding domain-containing protein [Flavobacterium sp.]